MSAELRVLDVMDLDIPGMNTSISSSLSMITVAGLDIWNAQIASDMEHGADYTKMWKRMYRRSTLLLCTNRRLNSANTRSTGAAGTRRAT